MKRTLLLLAASFVWATLDGNGAVTSESACVEAGLDLVPPRFLSARLVGTNSHQLLLAVDELLCTGQPGCFYDATDHFNWQVLDETTLEDLEIVQVQVDGTKVVFTLLAALEPGHTYRIQVYPFAGTISDFCGNLVSYAEFALTWPTAFFQQNVHGYTGLEDDDLSPPCDPPGSCALPPPFRRILMELSNAGDESQGLLQFKDILGNGSNQVPIGATIISATLTLRSTGPNANGDPVRMHRMLQPWSWSTGDQWTTFVNGIQPNGIEAHTNVDAVIFSEFLTAPFALDVDVTRSVQAWADGEPNHGWVLLATGTNGYTFDSSAQSTGPVLEFAYTTNRPALTITNKAGSNVIRWAPDSAWELVTSPSIGGPYTPVAGNPSGTLVVPATDRTNHAAFFRLRVRDGLR